MADGFGFSGKKQLEQTKWKVTVAPGSKTVGDRADRLDEQETQQCRSIVGTMYVGQDRPETQCATNEAARFMFGPTRGAKCMLKLLCNYSEAPVLSWSFPHQEEMPSEIRSLTDANWAGELEGLRSTSCGWTCFGDHLLETCRQQSRLWSCQLQRVNTSRSRRGQLTFWWSAVLNLVEFVRRTRRLDGQWPRDVV